MDFYVFLEKMMSERGLSIPDIARLSGLSDSTIRSAIDRKQKRVALDVAMKLSRGLGIPVEAINDDTYDYRIDESREALSSHQDDHPDFDEDVFLIAREARNLGPVNRELLKQIIASMAKVGEEAQRKQENKDE